MDDFNFYNSENDGYRGGFGDYVDPTPTNQPQYSAPQPGGPGRKRTGPRGSPPWSWPAPWWAPGPARGAPPSIST